MMKKLALCAALISSAITTATIEVDLNLVINEADSGYHRDVEVTVALENDESVVVELNDIAIEVSASNENEDGVALSCIVVKLEENEESNDDDVTGVVVANPTLITNWEQEASVSLGSSEGDLVRLAVTTHRSN